MALNYSAPPPELEIELGEVRADAAALSDIFKQVNTPLPDEFPKGAALEIAHALGELPDGTARGCLRPLIEAQSQLATIRSQHIIHEDHTNLRSSTPPLFRGELIDQKLRNLMSSVSTALQTANRLAVEEPEAESPEESTPAPKDNSAALLIQESRKFQNEIDQERQELDLIKNPDSERADSLRRGLTDVLVLNWLGRGELRMPRIVSARLRRIAASLCDYPAIINHSAEAITKGADVADYAYDKWHALKDRIFKAATQTLREIAEDIASFSRRLESRRRDKIQTEPSQPPPDFDILEATRMIHEGKAPPVHWRQFIETLPLGNRRLGTLDPLKGLTNLRDLTKVKVRVDDISVLSELVSLVNISLGGSRVSDLTPLSSLSSLQSISLDHTQVSDLKPLSSLSSLQSLYLDHTQVSDLKPLVGISSLSIVFITRTKGLEVPAKLSKVTHVV